MLQFRVVRRVLGEVVVDRDAGSLARLLVNEGELQGRWISGHQTVGPVVAILVVWKKVQINR